MRDLNWNGLLIVAASVFAGFVGYLFLAGFGFFVGLAGTLLIVFPFKSVIEKRRARLETLEDRVDALEADVEGGSGTRSRPPDRTDRRDPAVG
jgi:hypothetical protein